MHEIGKKLQSLLGINSKYPKGPCQASNFFREVVIGAFESALVCDSRPGVYFLLQIPRSRQMSGRSVLSLALI